MSNLSPDQNTYSQVSRRRFRLMTALVILSGVLILILVGLLTIPASAAQLSIIGNTLVICLVMLPMVICLAPIYLLIMLAIYGVFLLHNGTGSILERIQTLVLTWSDYANKFLGHAGRFSIGVHSRFAFISRLLRFFIPDDTTQPSSSKTGEKSS